MDLFCHYSFCHLYQHVAYTRQGSASGAELTAPKDTLKYLDLWIQYVLILGGVWSSGYVSKLGKVAFGTKFKYLCHAMMG